MIEEKYNIINSYHFDSTKSILFLRTYCQSCFSKVAKTGDYDILTEDLSTGVGNGSLLITGIGGRLATLTTDIF